MSDKITTLHPYDDDSTNVYPNIKSENIPDGSVTEAKLDPSIVDEINSLSEKYAKAVTTNTEQQITAQKTFTQGIKTNKVTNINGYDDMADDGTNLNVGNSSRAIKLLGSATRPQYNGSDVALLTDTSTGITDTIIESLSYGRWRNVPLYHDQYHDAIMYDALAPYYTTYQYFMANSYFTTDGVNPSTKPIYFDGDNFFGTGNMRCAWMFLNFNNVSDIYLPNMTITDFRYMFQGAKFTKILVKDGCTVKARWNCEWSVMFSDMPNLTEIGAFDFSNMNGNQAYDNDLIDGSPKVKYIHIKHWKRTFDISGSTAFGEDGLIEILSNLDTLSTDGYATLTMGATNLAKITSQEGLAQLALATTSIASGGKGWIIN